MIRQGNTAKELPKLVWSSTVKTLLLVTSLIYRGTEVNAQNDFQCIEEGYHADLNDCNIYYRCVDWGTVTSGSQSSLTSFKFNCGPGTVFSHIKGDICVHPNDSERTECRKSGNDLDSIMNDYEDNNQEEKYPHPSWPSSSQRPIKNPSYTSPKNPNKEYPSNPSYTPATVINQGYYTNSSSKPSNLPSYIPPSYTNQVNPSVVGNSTAHKPNNETEGLIGTSGLLPPLIPENDRSDCQQEGFKAHPKDCKKFIRCVDNGLGFYKQFEFTCGEGTLWDSTIEACNHEWLAKNNCFSQPISTQSSSFETTSSNQQSTSKQPITVPTNFTQSSGYLPPSTSHPVTFQPSQTQLSTSSLSSTMILIPSTSYSSTFSSLDITNVSTVSSQIENNSQGTSNGDCNTEGFFSNPDNCRKFYRCVTQEGQKLIKYEFECGEGTAWDTNIQNCNHEHAVPQCNRTDNNGSINVLSTESTNNGEETNKIPPDEESSTTKEPKISTQIKPKPSSESIGFSSTTSKSDKSTTIFTTNTIPLTTTPAPNEPFESLECNDEGFYANSNDCHKFYHCVKTTSGYTKYDFDCAPGTAWDQSILTCNYAHLVTTCIPQTSVISSSTKGTEKPMSLTTQPREDHDNSSPIFTTTSVMIITSSNSSYNQADMETSTTIENNANNNEDTKVTTENAEKSTMTMEKTEISSVSSSTIESNIKCDSVGFYPHPKQCDKFYRCVDNGNGYNVYHFYCAPGTIFDPSISVCNYPESVYPPRDCSNNLSGLSNSPVPSTTVILSTDTSESEATTQISTITSLDSNEETTITLAIDDETTTEFTRDTTEIQITTSYSESMSTQVNTDIPTMSSEEITELNFTEESTTNEKSDTITTESDDTEMTESTSGTEIESSTDGITTTTTAESDITPPTAPCTLGNLTDEQIVLVCPTGFRRHPKYCNMFYQCTSEGNMEIKVLVLVCPENTIFDEEKVQCLSENESSQSCNTQLTPARFYRQIEKSSTRPIRATHDSLCPGEGHYPYRKGCSNVFYKCRRNQNNLLQGYLYRCPNDFVYWSVSRRCEKANRLRTCSQEQHDQDREETVSWKKRWELPIENSNISPQMIHG